MNHRKKAVFNWSGGKDSALALQKVLKENEFEVISLLTTINAETLSSSIHSIPLEIISRQAKSIGIPLYTVSLSRNLDGYDESMADAILHFKDLGVTHFIFGDIFLSDIKLYRENKLHPYGIAVVEPLWNKTSKEVMEEFLQSGIKTRIVVTQADKLDKTYIGRALDSDFVLSLPGDVDPCGENGEYHTLSYAGDLFAEDIAFLIGETRKISYDIRLADGQIKTFDYWQAEILPG